MEAGQFDLPPCSFFKKLSFKETIKLYFFATFNVAISHIFPENFIESLLVVQMVLRLSLLTLIWVGFLGVRFEVGGGGEW